MQTFMVDKNLDLLHPSVAGMDHPYTPTAPERLSDFGFAFNDAKFSDRLLRIEILADPPEARGQTDEEVAMQEDAFRGDEDADSSGSNYRSMDYSEVQQVRTFHISSPILAAKSPFFYKLFSNGMLEAEQKLVTLRINASEEAALLELLNFMYSNKLSELAASALLDVLVAADKFEVASCTSYCTRLLCDLPMTPSSALLYLALPFSVLTADAVQPLTDAAKQFLAAHYKDITKSANEVMSLPLAGIEAILASDSLQVASEDVVFDFTLKWARTHYPELEERQEILGSRLARYIRFPLMSSRKLKKVPTCNDFPTKLAMEVVLEALLFKSEPLHRQRSQRIQAADGAALTTHHFVDRAYKHRPVKVIEFELPQPQSVVYLDLKREECESLFPSGKVYSQAFHLGDQSFVLSAHCNMDQQNSTHSFGLFLGMQEKGGISLPVEYQFSARSKPSGEFVPKYKGFYSFRSGKSVGYRNLFGISWSSFVADDSQYFINGTLHLRAELTIKDQVLHINPQML